MWSFKAKVRGSFISPEYVLTLLDERLLDVLQVLGAVIPYQAELGLEGVAMSVEQLVGHLLVLRLSSEEVEEVDDDPDDHDDLHVEVLPVGPQMGGDVDDLDRLLLGRARCRFVLLLPVRPRLVDELIRVISVVILVEALKPEVNILPNKAQKKKI